MQDEIFHFFFLSNYRLGIVELMHMDPNFINRCNLWYSQMTVIIDLSREWKWSERKHRGAEEMAQSEKFLWPKHEHEVLC